MTKDEYTEWYEKEQGGRRSITIGDVKAMLSDLPDDMAFKVSHQFDRHPVGIRDPIVGVRSIAVPVGTTDRGAPVMGMPEGGLEYFIVE